MDSFCAGMVVFGLVLAMVSCVAFAYDAGKGYTPFSTENLHSTGFLSIGSLALGSMLVGFFGSVILYEAWENGINRRVDEKLADCRRDMRSEIQDQYEKTLRKKKED
jgi:hypothetical protein